MLHFSIEYPQSQSTAVAKILDSAFAIDSYVSSFPHIFSDDSSALLACARTPDRKLVGLCAIDTEHWSEPRFLRGACIGSVAVAPDAQGKGVGSELLRWVMKELKQRACHDFLYLFSEKKSFYDALGFTAVGRECLYSIGMHSNKTREFVGCKLSELKRTTQMSETEQIKIWMAIERQRRSGESHASWSKFLQVCKMPDLWVGWSEDNACRVMAGAFVGKGVDFQGVMHNLFADSESALLDFFDVFCRQHHELSSKILVAPGLWSDCLTPKFIKQTEQNLCYVYPLTSRAHDLVQSFNRGLLYPRSLFSS